MTKEMELLGKLELSEENRAKLLALLEEGKKSGKVSSKSVETLDAVDATEEQTESASMTFLSGHVEIDVSDVLDLIGTADLDNPRSVKWSKAEGLPAVLDSGLPRTLKTPSWTTLLKEIGQIVPDA